MYQLILNLFSSPLPNNICTGRLPTGKGYFILCISIPLPGKQFVKLAFYVLNSVSHCVPSKIVQNIMAVYKFIFLFLIISLIELETISTAPNLANPKENVSLR